MLATARYINRHLVAFYDGTNSSDIVDYNWIEPATVVSEEDGVLTIFWGGPEWALVYVLNVGDVLFIDENESSEFGGYVVGTTMTAAMFAAQYVLSPDQE
jgi:hypothetical protein